MWVKSKRHKNLVMCDKQICILTSPESSFWSSMHLTLWRASVGGMTGSMGGIYNICSLCLHCWPQENFTATHLTPLGVLESTWMWKISTKPVNFFVSLPKISTDMQWNWVSCKKTQRRECLGSCVRVDMSSLYWPRLNTPVFTGKPSGVGQNSRENYANWRH